MIRRLLKRLRGLGTRGRAAAAEAGSPRRDPHGAGDDPEAADGDDARLRDDPDEVDRLVHLTFGALLRRDPDRDTLLAYREGFANGTTFRDLVEDVLGSDEYRSARRRLDRHRPAPEPAAEALGIRQAAEEMASAVTLLATRLAATGCSLPGDAAEASDGIRDPADRRRMRSLRATLSLLDRL